MKMKEKKPNTIIAPCPKCGKIPIIHDVSDMYDDEHMISCCGISKSREGYYETIESWNDYNVEYQLKTHAERSLDKITKCPICGSALKTVVYDNERMRITCGSGKRCINLVSKDCSRLINLLRNEDWQAVAEEVKSCPRCGGDKIEIWFKDDEFWIHCINAICLGRVAARGKTLEGVLAQWKEIVCDEPQVYTVGEAARRYKKMNMDKQERLFEAMVDLRTMLSDVLIELDIQTAVGYSLACDIRKLENLIYSVGDRLAFYLLPGIEDEVDCE